MNDIKMVANKVKLMRVYYYTIQFVILCFLLSREIVEYDNAVYEDRTTEK